MFAIEHDFTGPAPRPPAEELAKCPAGYFVAPDAFGDIWIWRERGEYPVPVIAHHDCKDDPELWDYITSALPHPEPGDDR